MILKNRIIYERDCRFFDCGLPFKTTDARKTFCTHRCAYLQTCREYYWADPEGQKERVAVYRSNNRDLIKVRGRQRYWNSPESYRKESRDYGAVRPIQRAVKNAHRTAKRLGVLSTLTEDEWRLVVYTLNQTCTYCGKKMDILSLTMDHVVPMSKGGTNTVDNVTVACLSCNVIKSDRDLDEFLTNRKKYKSRKG